MKIIIRNSSIVNEGKTTVADILIVDDRIEKIDSSIELSKNIRFQEINAEGLYLLPGIIDDQVHFREPGLSHKATIYSESKAAVAGGVTAFMDMPNTIPNTLTQELLEEKYLRASKTSLANYSFFMGINQNNLDEVLKTDNENVCGISDDGLYFNNSKGILANFPEFLETLFSRTESLVALHCEDDEIIENNISNYTKFYGGNIPFELHPLIRSEEACLTASKRVLEIAKRYNTRLHLLHISTLAEANLFGNTTAVRDKRITAEACIHHLWFSDKDYKRLGAKIKWNPSIKTERDQIGLLAALTDDKLDNVATDHAPHTLDEKSGNYFKSLSGGPMVQHALTVMLELFHQGKISIEKIVEKMSHNVAEIYRIKERGYLREGYYADLVLVDLNSEWKVTQQNTLYNCKWSPFENNSFKSKVIKTFVNGNLVYDSGMFNETNKGRRIRFEKFR